MEKTAVIIAAAGSSTRMGGGIPKQYRMCGNLPVLVKAVKAFCDVQGISDIIVTASEAEQQNCRNLLDRWGCAQAIVVCGGATRQESVSNALACIPEDCTKVLIHDGARPFVEPEVIKAVIEELEKSPAVIPCVQPKSTIRTTEETLDRSKLYEVQTPQGFRMDTLLEAFRKAKEDGFEGTDEAGLVERTGVKISIVPGSYKNIKLTTPEDFPVDIRIGNGYDVHRLVDGRPLMLACTQVPYEKGLLGHSDADVISHAIADAILGACALGDIGRHFPDNDPKYEGMAGKLLLSETARIVREAGFTIINIDATLIAQKPKVAPYIETMRENTAAALGLPVSCVSIKATTEEGLGFTGDGSAMAAMASASVK